LPGTLPRLNANQSGRRRARRHVSASPHAGSRRRRRYAADLPGGVLNRAGNGAVHQVCRHRDIVLPDSVRH
jgi:hypothetical protein